MRPQRDAAGDKDSDPFDDLAGGRSWHSIGRSVAALVLEDSYDQSDGEHDGCFTVSLDTGACRFVRFGGLVGISPVGDQIIVEDSRWAGKL